MKDLSDDAGWESVRDTLVGMVGGNAFPAFRLHEMNDRRISLEHQFEGRGLDERQTRGIMKLLRDLLRVSVDVTAFFPDADSTFKDKKWTETAQRS